MSHCKIVGPLCEICHYAMSHLFDARCAGDCVKCDLAKYVDHVDTCPVVKERMATLFTRAPVAHKPSSPLLAGVLTPLDTTVPPGHTLTTHKCDDGGIVTELSLSGPGGLTDLARTMYNLRDCVSEQLEWLLICAHPTSSGKCGYPVARTGGKVYACCAAHMGKLAPDITEAVRALEKLAAL